MKAKYYITNVFAKEKYAGNKLATFTNASGISAELMQKIAFEIGFPETTFITSAQQNDGSYDVRIFTPLEEVPFAGHPTLGTAFIIREHLQEKKADTILLNEKAGKIPVTVTKNGYQMQQNPPEFGIMVSKESMRKVLNLEMEDFNPDYKAVEISTGLPTTVVPLKNMEALKKAKINHEYYPEFIKQSNARPILVFSPDAYEPDQTLSVRMFADCFGITEDPATGSSNGCLAAYLAKYNFLGRQNFEIKVGQGYEINRPSELELKVKTNNNKIDIAVAGNVFPVAEGEWYV